jgi:excisionase family DNA binding protein
MTTAEVATELGVSRRQVQYLVRTGRLKATPHGRAFIVYRGDLDAVRVRKRGRPYSKK